MLSLRCIFICIRPAGNTDKTGNIFSQNLKGMEEMKLTMKRFLNMALVLVMLIGMLPSFVFAEENAGEGPRATVTVEEPLTLTAEEHAYVTWPEGDDTIDRPLQAVVVYEAQDAVSEAAEFEGWQYNLYLTFDGLKNGAVIADGCYLAGNYNDRGWIVIPMDGTEIQEGVEHSVVSNYDENLAYEDLSEEGKKFTTALYIAPEILEANPDFEVTLELRVKDPGNDANEYIVGEPEIFDVNELTGMVAANTATEKRYSTVDSALQEALEGETVKLIADVETDMLTVFAGKKLDLNGNELKVGYVVSFGDIVDSSEENSGRLVVSKDKFMVQKANAELPVWDGDAYVFTQLRDINVGITAEGKYAFQPLFAAGDIDLLETGMENSGISVMLRLRWGNEDGVRHQDFVYNNEMVQKFLHSYEDGENKYKFMFTLALTNALDNLSASVVIASETGVEVEKAFPALNA